MLVSTSSTSNQRLNPGEDEEIYVDENGKGWLYLAGHGWSASSTRAEGITDKKLTVEERIEHGFVSFPEIRTV